MIFLCVKYPNHGHHWTLLKVKVLSWLNVSHQLSYICQAGSFGAKIIPIVLLQGAFVECIQFLLSVC